MLPFLKCSNLCILFLILYMVHIFSVALASRDISAQEGNVWPVLFSSIHGNFVFIYSLLPGFINFDYYRWYIVSCKWGGRLDFISPPGPVRKNIVNLLGTTSSSWFKAGVSCLIILRYTPGSVSFPSCTK